MNTIIIGAGGIGKAHACALHRANFRLKAIVDIDSDTRLEYSKPNTHICNEWGSIKEYAPLADTTQVCSEISKDLLHDTELVIVSVPTDIHLKYLDTLDKLGYKGVVLVEKPCGNLRGFPEPDYGFICYVGYQWIWHPLVSQYQSNIIAVRDGHDYAPDGWKPNNVKDLNYLVDDLGCHSLSIIGQQFEPHSVELPTKDKPYIAVHATNGTSIEFGYSSPLSDIREDCGIEILTTDSKIQLRWCDMYDIQLLAIKRRDPRLIGLQTAVEINCKLETIKQLVAQKMAIA